MSSIEEDILPLIAIQGFEGSFHHKAANTFFKEKCAVFPCNTFSEVITQAENSDKIDHGLMAIENSIAGSILPNYTLLKDSKLHIIGETYLQIGQHFMALKGQKIEDITEVRSHHMAIKQCMNFLNKYPYIKVVETEDTALSAKIISENKLNGVAAIASEFASTLYGLEIISHHIEAVPNNYTRFLLLSKENNEVNDANKASFILSLRHEKGALSKILNLIASLNFNLTKIQSFPIIEEEWQYYFVIDIESEDFKYFDKLLDELAMNTLNMRVLGKYRNGLKL